MVEEAFGKNPEYSRDNDKACQDGWFGRRLGEHSLRGYEIVVDRFGERTDTLKVVDQHWRTGDRACPRDSQQN